MAMAPVMAVFSALALIACDARVLPNETFVYEECIGNASRSNDTSVTGARVECIADYDPTPLEVVLLICALLCYLVTHLCRRSDAVLHDTEGASDGARGDASAIGNATPRNASLDR